MNLSTNNLNPYVSVDCVIFGFDCDRINVLLIERESIINNNENTIYALPGNLIGFEEDLDQSAKRVLQELTQLKNIYLEQFSVFGNVDRTKDPKDQAWLTAIRDLPNERVLTVAYYALINQSAYQPNASSFAKRAYWHPLDDLPNLAFDHNQIVKKAIESLRIAIRVKPFGYELLPKKFTLSQFQNLYESILGYKLDKRNFRRKIAAKDFLYPIDEWQKDVSHKPAQYYSFDLDLYHKYRETNFDFSF